MALWTSPAHWIGRATAEASMMVRWSWSLALVSVSLIACSSDDGGAPSSGDSGADVVNVAPEGGASDAAVVAVVGASGGAVSAQGVALTIPSGALATDTQ